MAAESKQDPTISASALIDLAEKAELVGAKRYAEAYRLVAYRLRELDKAEPEAQG